MTNENLKQTGYQNMLRSIKALVRLLIKKRSGKIKDRPDVLFNGTLTTF